MPTRTPPDAAATRLLLLSCFLLAIDIGVVSALPIADSTEKEPPSLEEIAYGLGTDKSKDDHKYVDLYMTLFDPIRSTVRNVTEFGAAHGQSMVLWRDYFPNAHVWGIDRGQPYKHFLEHFMRAPVAQGFKRLSWGQFDAYDETALARFAEQQGWANESMDIVIDDALHDFKHPQMLLKRMWRFVKPGGYYIIEDVGPNKPDQDWLNEDTATATVAKILRESTTFYADTLFGHRNWTKWQKTTMWGTHQVYDRLHHDGHVIVIRKRVPAHPQRPTPRSFFGDGRLGEGGGAMRRGWLNLTEEQRVEAMYG